MTLRQAVADALVHFVWQGAAIGVVAAIALRAFQSRTAAARHAICLAALMLCVAAPAVTTWVLYTGAFSSSGGGSIAALANLVETSARRPNAAGSSWLAGIRPFVIPAWLVGALLCSMRLVYAGRHVRHVRATALAPSPWIIALLERVAERLRVTSAVRVAMSNLVDGPSTIGWLRPLILLPAAVASGLTTDQLETIIAHELAHIRRYDYLANVMQTIVETVLFYHPVIWWLSARAREERELCCDDVVLAHYDARLGYARALVSVARLRVGGHSLALGASDGALTARVRRILGHVSAVRSPIVLPALVAVCVIIACVGSIADPTADTKTLELREVKGTINGVDGTETVGVAFLTTLDAAKREVEAGPVVLPGRRISIIQVKGLSDDVRARLRLPVTIGDVVTEETERQVERSVHALSRDLTADIVPLPNGRAAVMITPFTPPTILERERK